MRKFTLDDLNDITISDMLTIFNEAQQNCERYNIDKLHAFNRKWRDGKTAIDYPSYITELDSLLTEFVPWFTMHRQSVSLERMTDALKTLYLPVIEEVINSASPLSKLLDGDMK